MNIFKKNIFLSTLFLLISANSEASPYPLMASSIINTIQNNLVLSQMGFKIQTIPQDWVIKNNSDNSSKSIIMGLPQNINIVESKIEPKTAASLSFRYDTISIKTNLEQHVRQYLRDYNQYGFEVINLQSNKKSKIPTVIVDLSQKNKKTRSRQVFFSQSENLIIATCLDNYDDFDKFILICNKILNDFEWTKTTQ